MDLIFHEKQDGQLCAQHCLNALLQGPYYSAVDLASLAHQLDEEERQIWMEGLAGPHPEDMQRLLQRPSSNVDETGFFSVQVISKALAQWALTIVSYGSSEDRIRAARLEPCNEKAFICNYREHWLTVRRIGRQWFNLNSLLAGPELISDTFLSMFLEQLMQEGYTVYVVLGDLPFCSADEAFSLMDAVQSTSPALLSTQAASSAALSQPETARMTGESDADEEDENLRKAVALSLQDAAPAAMEHDHDLQLAIRLSLMEAQSNSQMERSEQAASMPLTSSFGPHVRPTDSSKASHSLNQPQAHHSSVLRSLTESRLPGASESMPGMGNQLGAGSSGGPSQNVRRGATPDVDEVRKRRLAYLDKAGKPQ